MFSIVELVAYSDESVSFLSSTRFFELFSAFGLLEIFCFRFLATLS